MNFTSKGMRETDVEDDCGSYDKSTFKVFSHYAEILVLAAVKFRVVDDFKVVFKCRSLFCFGYRR